MMAKYSFKQILSLVAVLVAVMLPEQCMGQEAAKTDNEKVWLYFTPAIWMGVLTMLFLVFFLIAGVCLLGNVQTPNQFEEATTSKKQN
eukprot:Nk52_evm31s359 gene=Nk52_evmTU31s359